ncbi:hypothetical protein C0585_07640 [Candidatus Woesearchaeota archaeon]|nr:MAG: hypothetical protein C0585_07640 [Candidatus Woesearchaeota archaeon]
MYRKIIKQGKGAYTISLPKNWIEKNNLSNSNQIEVIEEGLDLLIKSKKKKSESNISIELDEYSTTEYRNIIGSLYRGGYDTIEIKAKKKLKIKNLQEAINSIYGLELFYENNNYIIKTIYLTESTNINDHIKLMVSSISQIQNLIILDVENNNKDSSKEINRLRNIILKQRDLIIRIIKKEKLFDNNIFPFYNISISLWNIARSYMHMYEDIKNIKNIQLFESVADYFNSSFSSFKLSENELRLRNKKYQKQYLETTNSNSNMKPYLVSALFQIQQCDSYLYLLSK